MSVFNRKKYLFMLFFLLGIILFLPCILRFQNFMFGTDQEIEYNYFYVEWMRMIRSFIDHRTFPFYSFETFLGNNFYASKAFYVTGDVFACFLLFFKDVRTGLMVESLLITGLSGFSFIVIWKSLV